MKANKSTNWKNKKKVWLPVVCLLGLGAVATYMMDSSVAKPDLYTFTHQKLKSSSLFKSCVKDIPSLNIQITDNDWIKFNGIASKVTFVTNSDVDAEKVKCTGLEPGSARQVKTAAYTMILSKSKNGYVIYNLINNQTDEVVPGVWYFSAPV